jgi:hypothetical protein
MKKILLLCIITLISSQAFSQETIISQRLQQKLNNHNPVEFISVLILLKERIDVEILNRQLYDVNINQRAKTVIEALQQKAEISQRPVLDYLTREQNFGKVREIESFWITNLIQITATPEIIFNLSRRQEIEIMDIDALLDYDKPVSWETAGSNIESTETGIKVINADKLWALGIDGTGSLVMGHDTGVDYLHPQLFPKWRGNNGAPSYHAWFDPGGTEFPSDCDGHGTHTVGTMVGSVTGDTIGVAPGAQWIAGKTICSTPATSRSIAAYQWAMNPDSNTNTTDDMPVAINCSWYDPTDAGSECVNSIYRSVLSALEAAGIAVVFSAGNNGPAPATCTPPKNINIDSVHVFAVGAVNGNVPGYPIASFSSRGPSTCGGLGTLLIKPEVSAPGQNVRSSLPEGAYGVLSGTSMAAPHVSGAIALLKQVAPNLTGHQIKSLLLISAVDLGTAGEDNDYGRGLIDVYAAYLLLGPGIAHSPLSNTENLTGPYSINANIVSVAAPLDPSSVKLVWGRNSLTDTISMTGSGGNNWTANIPGNGLPAEYRYYIIAEDSSGNTGRTPVNAPNTYYSFIASTDLQPPVIDHPPIVDLPKGAWPINVDADVTDNIGIDSVWVSWYKNQPGNLKQFALNNVLGDRYSAAFNSANNEVVEGDSIFYRIYAKDNSISGNTDSTGWMMFRIMSTILCEGFNLEEFPPKGWTIEKNSAEIYWQRVLGSSYGSGSGSAKFAAYDAPDGNIQNLISLVFEPTALGDSLRFDVAHAPYPGRADTLTVFASTDGGSTYTTIAVLPGEPIPGMGMTTALPQTGSFTPTAGQWAEKKYSLPAGTNRINFRARSVFGNNFYIDSVCTTNGFSTDVGIISLGNTGRSFFESPSINPAGYVRNYGLEAASFSITRTIEPGGYSSTKNISDLPINNTIEVQFDQWTFTHGQSYTIKDTIIITGDQNSLNNSAAGTIVPNVAKTFAVFYKDAAGRDSLIRAIDQDGRFVNDYDVISADSVWSLRPWKTVFGLFLNFWTPAIRDSMKSFLDNSTAGNKKSLLVFSYDFGFNYDPNAEGYILNNSTSADADFYRNYLRTRYLNDDWYLLFPASQQKIKGNPLDPDFNTYPNDSISGTYPDLIDTINGSKKGIIPFTATGADPGAVLVYYFGTDYNIVNVSNPYSYFRRYGSIEGPVTFYTYIVDKLLDAGGALPVELASFTAAIDKRDVHLNWKTASELNNSGFEIERSYKSDENVYEDWVELGFVQGNGTTAEARDYSFTDRGLNTGKYKYRLKQVDYNGNFEYFNLSGEVSVGIPDKYDLSQNYPNPFNPATKINFDLPFDSRVTMKIFDITGRELKTLANEIFEAGYYTITFNAVNIASGVYFYRIIAEGGNQQYVMTKKMILLR